MTTAAVLAPTHRAYFPEIPGAEITFHSSLGLAPVDEFVKKHPGAGQVRVEALTAKAPTPSIAAGSDLDAEEFAAPRPAALPVNSTWTKTVTDDAAKARIEAQHASLESSGIVVGAERQLYATGTRMADVGYAAQAKRAVEHDRKMPLRDAAEQLAELVRAERREDVAFSAGELGRAVQVNGKLTVGGYSMQEQAIRGLLARIDSPAGKYVFGLRERIADRVRLGLEAGEDPKVSKRDLHEANLEDKAQLAQVLRHELGVAAGQRLVLRTRKLADGTSDAFAAVSPKYAPADAPEVIGQILRALPSDAKGSYSYDPSTTSWELRAELWTPTPVAEQAVGEPFRGYVSFRSRDDGTGSLRGGGGIEILACLNASTYVAGSADVERRHIGKIVAEAEKMISAAKRSIDALCQAWGRAREQVVELPAEFEAQLGLSISKAIPGFWWGTLSDRKSELNQVLPGRTKAHVAGLTDAYFAERRDPNRIVRADFAQAWTRYVQDQPSAVRRDAEAAIASWTVSGRMPKFDGDRVEVGS